MEIQKTLGQLQQSVTQLTEQSKRHGEKLDRISHIIFAAGVVGALLLAVGSFILNKIWNVLIAALTAAG